MSITILMADDSEFIRKAIRYFLKGDPEIQILAEAASFRQTIELASKFNPQVIVMDVYMGRSGNNVTPSEIELSLGDSKILAMSFSDDEETKAIARSFGAVEWLDKTKLADELIPAIKST